MTLYLDCEWTLDQNIFLIGYAYSDGSVGSIYGPKLTKKFFMQMVKGVDYIIVYGPDIAMLEKYFQIDLRNKIICINALQVFRKSLPGLRSYKLAYVEELFAIVRKKRKYKTSVFTIWKDWAHPDKKQHVITYNLEDVRNMMTLFNIIVCKYNISDQDILQSRLI
ncbi:MAG: ribonuclease H-like domain-containing protein [Saprospiraceae bacterium]